MGSMGKGQWCQVIFVSVINPQMVEELLEFSHTQPVASTVVLPRKVKTQ